MIIMQKILNIFPKTVIVDSCTKEKGPLMVRYYLTPKIFSLRVCVHKFLRSDNDRHYHDHPWNFISFVLKGHYYEHFPFGSRDANTGKIYVVDCVRRISRFDLIKRPKEWKHWVELPEKSNDIGIVNPLIAQGIKFIECWTLILFYGRRRDWRFWTEQDWV